MTNDIAAIETVLIALNKLDPDPKNVRKTYSKEGVAELAGTIRADGFRLLQNIIVRKADKKGRFFVTAGGRRLAALTLLAEAGEIARDFPVECKVRDGSDATEVSLIENSFREGMNPVDEYEAFRVMAEEGKAIADIAIRFATTETIVKRRLALARVSPVLLALYREEQMTFEQLSAFTLSDDHDRQVEVWNNLPSWNRSAHTIRAAIQSEALKASDKRIKFIGGLEAYEAAGGSVRRDLFDQTNSGYATDLALVEKLVAAKLEAEAEQLRSEGWKWVECANALPDDAHRMRRIYPQAVDLTTEQQAELDALDAEYTELTAIFEAEEADDVTEVRFEEVGNRMEELRSLGEAYRPEDIERAGCYVSMDYYGNLLIERGLIRPDDMKVEASATGNEEQDDEGKDETGVRIASEPEPAFAMSAALVQELSAQKTAAIRAELAHNPDIALVAVVHALLLSTFLPYSADNTCLDLRVTSEALGNSIKDPASAKGIQTMDSLRDNHGHTIPGDPADLWGWCIERTQGELLELLAFVAATSVNAVQFGHYARSRQRAHADRMAQALKMDMSQWFEPTAANYFSRISKTGIEQALTEAKGADFASGVSAMKKADAAAYAERQIAGTGWLPAPIRIAAVSPQEADEAHDVDEDAIDDAGDDAMSPAFPEAAE